MTYPLNKSAENGMDRVSSADNASPVRVLVVEDESIVAMYLTDVLEDMDYEVCGVAASAADALTIAERERPSLALVDIGLAGSQDGIETARALRERYAVGSIFMSGASDPELLERAKTVHPHGFLQKPYDADQLKNALDRVFSRH
jgi:Response regulator of citrate/malate metabolism